MMMITFSMMSLTLWTGKRRFRKRFSLLIFLGLCSLILSHADEVISIGSLGEEGELISPQEMKEGPDGNIYIYDQQDGFIKVYSQTGKFVRKIGGQGQGPGEIQRIEDVSFGFLPDGNFLAQVSFIGMPKKLKDYFLHSFPVKLFILDKNGAPITELMATNHYLRISYLSGGGDAGIPFTPHFSWCYYKEGLILSTDGLSNKIKVHDFKGSVIREMDTSLPKPEKVTRKDLDTWRQEAKESLQVRDGGAWYNQFGNVIEKYKKSIYDVKPILSSLSRTPEGNIFIAGIWDTEKNARRYWLLDENGAGLAELNVSVNDIHITKSFIFFKTVDEDFFSHVKAFRRSGTEKEDFMRLSDKIEP